MTAQPVKTKHRFPVAEHFVSINGEGTRSGELSYFIRFRGCRLACSYCDTEWARREEGACQWLSSEDLLRLVSESGVSNVTLTGGEPLQQEELPALLRELLLDPGRRVEIETNGSIGIQPFLNQEGRRPCFTVDYKLPGSGMENSMKASEWIPLLQEEDAVKFVVSGEEDLDRACEMIREHDLTKRCSVFFSPVFGKIEAEQIVQYMIAHRLNDIRLGLQIHKVIWDPDRRGV